MFYALITFIIAAFGFSAAEKVPLPPISICKRNLINYSDCLKDAIQESWPHFVKGFPQFDFPPLDPVIYEFGNVVIERGIINGRANVSNFIFEGFAKTHFLGARSYFLNKVFQLEIDIQISEIAGSGLIDIVGTLGPFEMTGKGLFNVTIKDVQGSWIIKGHVANDKWTIEDFYAAPSIKKMTLYFDLFKDKEINNLVVTFANEYWPALYRLVLPTVAKTYNPWLCDLANRFFSKVSFTKIFP